MANSAIVDMTLTDPVSNDSLFEQLQSEAQVETQIEVQSEPDLPPKFKGKPVDEIVRSYEELEAKFGKQGQELGELRKLTDEILKRQLASGTSNGDTSSRQSNDDTELAILNADPDLDRAIAKKLAPVLEEVREVKKEKMTSKLNESHPDFIDIVKDTEFQDWVKANRVRLDLFAQADQNYDFKAADELFSAWKDRKGSKPAAAKETKKVTEETFKKATMETGVASESAPGKIYSRADIMRLNLEDPYKYAQLQPEIMKAYAEGRVR